MMSLSNNSSRTSLYADMHLWGRSTGPSRRTSQDGCVPWILSWWGSSRTIWIRLMWLTGILIDFMHDWIRKKRQVLLTYWVRRLSRQYCQARWDAWEKVGSLVEPSFPQNLLLLLLFRNLETMMQALKQGCWLWCRSFSCTERWQGAFCASL